MSAGQRTSTASGGQFARCLTRERPQVQVSYGPRFAWSGASRPLPVCRGEWCYPNRWPQSDSEGDLRRTLSTLGGSEYRGVGEWPGCSTTRPMAIRALPTPVGHPRNNGARAAGNVEISSGWRGLRRCCRALPGALVRSNPRCRLSTGVVTVWAERALARLIRLWSRDLRQCRSRRNDWQRSDHPGLRSTDNPS